jgi:hypothetical protein
VTGCGCERGQSEVLQDSVIVGADMPRGLPILSVAVGGIEGAFGGISGWTKFSRRHVWTSPNAKF